MIFLLIISPFFNDYNLKLQKTVIFHIILFFYAEMLNPAKKHDIIYQIEYKTERNYMIWRF